MKETCLITGVAGFIGSHLAERLIKENYYVIGIDSFEDYYPRWMKEENIKDLLAFPRFKLIENNLLNFDLYEILSNVNYIFHEAAQAGVRSSWGNSFSIYTNNNILATQRLLESAKDFPLKKFIYASSSSVYGDAKEYPLKEDMICKPISPYGVSKLAGENLCYLYWKNYKIPIVSLRYFTVYGPRQRPDMAFHRFIKTILEEREIEVYGDGNQTRDFTYISDIIDANILAMNCPDGEIFNIGGGSRVELKEAINIIEELTGINAKIRFTSYQKGDVKDTFADLAKANNLMNYKPKVGLKDGLKKEIEWAKSIDFAAKMGNNGK